jgi:hypothetical protein
LRTSGAASLDRVFDLLARYGDEARLLAGGQSLFPTLNLRLSAPALLIDINGLDELAGIAVNDSGLRIGALTRQRTVEESDEVCAARPAPQDGDAAHRASGDPQPRHDRRQHRICRSGGRVAGLRPRRPQEWLPIGTNTFGDGASAGTFATAGRGAETFVIPMMEFLLENAADPNRISFLVTGVYKFRVGVRRSGSTDTITSADLSLRKDGVNA